MTDDFTDLTEDTEDDIPSNNKKSKKEKSPMAPKAPKPPKAPKAAKLPKPKKGKPIGPTTEGEKSGSRFLLFTIVIVLLISCIVAGSIVFNFFGVRDFVRDTLVIAAIRLDPEFNSMDFQLEHRSRQLDTREEQLRNLETVVSELERELTGLSEIVPLGEYENFAEFLRVFVRELIRINNQNNTRQAQLDRRSAALDRREESGDTIAAEQLPLFRRNLSQQEIDDITTLAQTFTRMAPEAAAEILTELNDPNHVASLLFFMRDRDAAAILAAMSTEFAAELTEILLE